MKNNNSFNKLNPFLKHQAIQKLINKCPLCGLQYKTVQAKIIEENEEAQLVYIKCQKCYGGVLLLILSSGPLVSSIGLITDLVEEDIVKYKNTTFLGEEDVLSLHQLLKTKNFCLNFKK